MTTTGAFEPPGETVKSKVHRASDETYQADGRVDEHGVMQPMASAGYSRFPTANRSKRARRPDMQNHNMRLLAWFVVALATIALSGWVFGYPLLNRYDPTQSPMMPGTAACFILSGLTLVISGKWRNILIGALLLLASALGASVLFDWHTTEAGFLMLPARHHAGALAHMSLQTIVGILAFSIGQIAVQRNRYLPAAISAGMVFLISLAAIFGYLLNLHYIFEQFYIASGLIWMSLPSSIELFLLGMGLTQRILRGWRSEDIQINRVIQVQQSAMFVVVITSLSITLIGMKLHEESIMKVSTTNTTRILDFSARHIDSILNDSVRIASLTSESLKPSLLSTNPKHIMTSHVRDFNASPFSGIALEQSGQVRILVGSLLPSTTLGIHLALPADATLLWRKHYYLRLRVPLDANRSLIFDQPLHALDQLFATIGQSGITGTMPMCGRLDPHRLLCYPQREQPSFWIVTDTYQGKSLPMTLALDGEHGVSVMTDYRGHSVFAAYRPIADTGLGLVSREDMSELYAPIRLVWLLVLPVVIILFGFGYWLIRLNVKPVIEHIEASNSLRKVILQSAAYSIISTDPHGTIVTFNDAAERMLWYSARDMVGKATPQTFHDPEEIRQRAAELSRELGQEITPGFEVFVAKPKIQIKEEREWTYIRRDGTRIPVRLSVTVLRDKRGEITGYLGIAHDISEERRNQEYIRHVALHDMLTGLPNRMLLEDRINMAIMQQQRDNTPFFIGMLDIDHFKRVNDSMGHHIGDRLIKAFAERVKSCLRSTDTLARMGGDEFAIVMPDCTEQGVRTIAERIQREIRLPIDVGLQELHITSSIGFSTGPEDGPDLHELLRCADTAMYWIKEHGRNGYKLYSKDMDRGRAERLNIEKRLHEAVDEKRFVLFYQPKTELQSGDIIGVEALLRLQGPNNSYLSPGAFIAVAEDTGLIVPIGEWVLETACRDSVQMQKKFGPNFHMSVNVSPRQFINAGLADTVRKCLAGAGLSASCLVLEITENILMDERNNVLSAMNELHSLGVRIAIDDFGTGYSSLSYLKRFPISQIKIDQSFVRGVPDNKDDAALVVAIISMAHTLQMPVIAEGIETQEQLDYLRAQHCDHGQGYLLGHPMPLDSLLNMAGKPN